MREPIEHGTGQSLAAEDFSPLLKGKIRSYDQRLPFICAADHLKEQLRPQLAGRSKEACPRDRPYSIRSIKANLNLSHVRCKSPRMVGREVWTTLLAYNLIRATAAGAALLHDKQPRQVSFTATCQYVLSSWMQLSCGLIEPSALKNYLRGMLRQIAHGEVANRPGRLEPRVLKRRRHGYKLMQKPRAVLRNELRRRCT